MGEVAAPRSQSTLWFVKPEQLDDFSGGLGRGAVWLDEQVGADEPSDAYLFGGFQKRTVHLATDAKATLTFEVDATGAGEWSTLATVDVDGYAWHRFAERRGLRRTRPARLGQALPRGRFR